MAATASLSANMKTDNVNILTDPEKCLYKFNLLDHAGVVAKGGGVWWRRT